MRKFHLSGVFLLATIAIAALPFMLLGPTAEAASLSFSTIIVSALLIEPAAFPPMPRLRAQLGEVGEGMTLAALEKAMRENFSEFKKFCEKADGEIKSVGTASSETKQALEKTINNGNEIMSRLDKLEARAARALGGDDTRRVKSIGEMFVETDEAKAMFAGKAKHARMQVKDIVNATGQNQPLVPVTHVPGIVQQPLRRLTIRDLLPVGRTGSNLIEYTKELVFTNAASPQYEASPERFENIKKNKSDITFQLATAAVVTLAHYIKASKQVLSDSPQLESYINGRLSYGLKLEEENEILNGAGTSGTLSGLVTQATAFNRGGSNDTKLDTLRKSMTQCALSEFSCTGFVLNPADWESIELTKDTQGRYIVGDPNGLLGPRLWSLPVVATNSMPVGHFLSGAFAMCAQLWDREDAAVQVGYENDDFTKNMVTILAEERIALTVYRPQGLITGTL